MAVTTTNNNISYTGNGTTTAFAVTFQFFDDTDLIVYVTDTNGNTTTKVLNSDYTVSGGSDSTGTVTFTTAPASGYVIQIVRDVPYTQPDTFLNNDINDATVQMWAIDRLTMLTQQAAFSASRNVSQPSADTTSMSALPTAANRAGKYLAFDSNGNPIATTQIGSWRGTWATATSYIIGDVIVDGAAGDDTLDVYVCLVANTSGTWATDLAAGDWAKVIDVVQIGDNTIAALAATSTTSVTIGTGSQSFTATLNKAFPVGSFVTVVDSASITNWMAGQVTAYDGATGALTVNVTATAGSGTIATWNIYSGGAPGAQVTAADPTATISGGAAQNGTAATFMRSDAAPALALTTASTNLGVNNPGLNTSTYTDLLSLSLSAGTWLITGKVLFKDSTTTNYISMKLWNGATVYDAVQGSTAGSQGVTLPTGAIVTLASTTTVKISAISMSTSTTNAYYEDAESNSPASQLLAVRIG